MSFIPNKPKMVLSTEWSQIEVITINNDGNGWGFMLVGGKSTGVVIKTVIPGSAVERDGRLQPGDHVLQIGDVNLRGFSSEQVATVLRQAGPQIKLLVARPAEATTTELEPHAPIVPTKILSNTEELDKQLSETQFLGQTLSNLLSNEVFATSTEIIPETILPIAVIENTVVDESPISYTLPETESFTVSLIKNSFGLGITVAGYVCVEEGLSGIFVRSIIDGSAAKASQKIEINDRIIEVDNQSIIGLTNKDAVNILRNTGETVSLKFERFLRGPCYEFLQNAFTSCDELYQSNCGSEHVSVPIIINQQDYCDSDATSESSIDSVIVEGENNECGKDTLDVIKQEWVQKIGNENTIVVDKVHKLSELGISLEGTVDVENGLELRPHHYIRSILPDGPVGQSGLLKPGDELLQVNDQNLQNLNHTEVVQLLRKLPEKVHLVCARGTSPNIINTSQNQEAFATRSILTGNLQNIFQPVQKEKSISEKRKNFKEHRNEFAMWNSDSQFIDLLKTEDGLGFSILDYQDPLDASDSVIVIRGLIPGGSADLSKLIFPGDKLISVDDVQLKGKNLNEVVSLLKSLQIGLVKLEISKPLGAIAQDS